MRGVIGYAVDAQALAHVVEKDIARLYDCLVQIHDAVRALSINPALELPSIECRVRRTKRGEARGRNFVFEHRRGHDDFEDGARRELCLNRAIQQRLSKSSWPRRCSK